MSYAANPSPYSQPGSHSQGVWLVAKDGAGAIVDASNVPPSGTGFTYYWLGTTVQEASSRLGGALTALNVNIETGVTPPDLLTAIQQAFTGGKSTLPKGTTGILRAIQNALAGGVFLSGPVESPGAAGAGATTEGATTAGAAGAGGAAGYASKALSSLSDIAKAGGIAALLIDPSFLWRMVKIVGGLALAYVGVKQLATVGGHQ